MSFRRKTIEEAYQKALACDPVSAFGGIVAVNRPVSEALAKALSEIFLEVVIAPKFSLEAQEVLKEGESSSFRNRKFFPNLKTFQNIDRYLVECCDKTRHKEISENDLTFVTEKPNAEVIDDLIFAWKICKFVKSNAIVIAKMGKHSVLVAGKPLGKVFTNCRRTSGRKSKGAVAASDAFFHFLMV